METKLIALVLGAALKQQQNIHNQYLPWPRLLLAAQDIQSHQQSPTSR